MTAASELGRRESRLNVTGSRGASTLYRLAELAAAFVGAPYAAITVIERDTRYFYAAIGTNTDESPMSGALCGLTVEGFEPVVVDDVDADPRFFDRRVGAAPLEPTFPKLRFYAGVPIIVEGGKPIGTLFVADDAPRSVDQRVLTILQSLAESAVDSFRLVESLQKHQTLMMEAYARRAELEKNNRELQRSKKHTEIAAELANIGFWSYDLKTQSLETSPSFRRICALDSDQPTMNDFISVFDEGSQQTFRNNVEVTLLARERFDIKLPLATQPDAKPRWIRTIARMELKSGQPDRLIGCSQDISETVQSKQSISKLAMLDTLTGAYNRRFLPVAFMKMARQIDFDTQKLVLMLVDLDHFKFVNDTKGHDAGDEVLKEVTAILRAEVRGGDIVGRVGGDEFLVLSSGPATIDFGRALSHRLVERALRSPVLRQHATPVTLSIGYTDVTTPDKEFAQALKEADLAVYEAKAAGRCRAQAYEDALGEQTSRRDRILSEIDAALRADDIVPVYQPKIGLVSGAVVGLEALARWRGPEGKLLPPAAFIEAFEDINFCRRISDRILDRSMSDAGRLNDAGFDFGRMAVNVTETQLVDPNFPPRLDELCARHGLTHDQIEVEVTEKALLTRMPDKIKAGLRALSDRGVNVAFDDFGTGYASLTHLREFDINTIKIDKSFVQSLSEDAAAQTITSSLVQMAINLNLEVVAEGIETTRSEAFLKQMGCHVGQGYLYSKPIPYQDIIAFISARHG